MRKFNVIAPTDIGTFIINKNDLGVGWQLSTYGCYESKEMAAVRVIIDVLRENRKRDLFALDIGANIGIHSVFLSDLVGPSGKVYAFEAQRIVFYMLAGNISINAKNNVYCYHNAVADRPHSIDIPQFDYGKPLSFGSVEFGGKQTEWIGQAPNPISSEKVQAIAIDDLKIEDVDFIKIDVEGMELAVLTGAKETIELSRPIVLAEYLKSDKTALAEWFKSRHYTVYSGIGDNYLCVPLEIGVRFGDLTELE